MFRGLTKPEHKGGFHLLDQYGVELPGVTALHEEAKGPAFAHIQKILGAGGAVAKL